MNFSTTEYIYNKTRFELDERGYIHPIKRESQMQKIYDQNTLIKNTREGNFIIAGVTEAGFSVSANPTVHTTQAAARAECKRLATQNVGKNFVILQLKGLEFVPASQSLSL